MLAVQAAAWQGGDRWLFLQWLLHLEGLAMLCHRLCKQTAVITPRTAFLKGGQSLLHTAACLAQCLPQAQHLHPGTPPFMTLDPPHAVILQACWAWHL